MIAQPQTVANELISEIARYAIAEKKPSELEIRRLKNKAIQLKSVDKPKSYMCLGMIACLENNIDESKTRHETSINIGHEYEFHINYFCSLNQLGLIFDAFRCLENALSIYPGNIDLLISISRISFLLGFYKKTIEYIEKIQLTKSNLDLDIDYILKESRMILDLNLPVETTNQVAKFLDEISVKYSAKIKNVRHIPIDEGILKQIETSADVDTTIDMNFDLYDKFSKAENFDLGKLSISFR
jgi:tetratricopeptide (TPR) repeat protein